MASHYSQILRLWRQRTSQSAPSAMRALRDPAAHPASTGSASEEWLLTLLTAACLEAAGFKWNVLPVDCVYTCYDAVGLRACNGPPGGLCSNPSVHALCDSFCSCCRECIVSWCNSGRSTCPMCRRSMNLAQMVLGRRVRTAALARFSQTMEPLTFLSTQHPWLQACSTLQKQRPLSKVPRSKGCSVAVLTESCLS